MTHEKHHHSHPHNPGTATGPDVVTIQDLKVAADIIGICTQRGAFRANELSAVGLLYDRLAAFLAANEPAAPETTTAAEAVQPQE